MVKNYILDKVIDRIKKIIGIEENDILPDDVTFKNAVALMTSVIKGDGKFYPQLFLEEALCDE